MKAAPATPAAPVGAVQPGLVKVDGFEGKTPGKTTNSGECGGKPGENAGEIIDSLGTLIEDHRIIVVFQGICDVNWDDIRNLHLANLFLMDSRDDGIHFISDHI